MDIQEFIFHERGRGDCYRLLSACFYLPKKSWCLEENLLPNLSMLLKTVCPEALPFSKRMEEAFPKYTDEELAIEYARLFVGPYELRTPPYGSIYLDGERKVMGDSTLEVMELYREAGLSIDEDFKELPDHIAVELEFMYYLIHQEVEALVRLNFSRAMEVLKRQDLFLNRFLGPWIEPFCKNMREETENEFYLALADCLFVLVMDSRRRDRLLEASTLLTPPA